LAPPRNRTTDTVLCGCAPAIFNTACGLFL